MELQKVKSTNIAAVGYDKESRMLRILFHTGTAYDYQQVPATLYNQLIAASSKGEFFQEHVKEQFKYEKVNLEKERNPVGKNKQQVAAEARAKKSDNVQPAAVAEPPKPKPEAPAAAPLPAPSKQQVTFDKLKAAWTAKGVDLSKLTATPDGKYLDVVVAEGWPLITVGASGGITLPQIRSYTSAFAAAVDGLAVFQKQNARDAKKAAAPAPTPAPAKEPKETVTQKKAKQGAAVEAQLQSASA